MKKKYIIFTTLVALFVTFGLLTASVFAALKINFGINNTITFYGGSQNIKFSIDAEIFGTVVLEGEENPKTYREYDYNTATSSLLEQWVIGSLELDPNAEEVGILYQFEISNTGASKDLDILAYIEPINIDDGEGKDLTYEITGKQSEPIKIVTGTKGIVSLKLIPTNENGFIGARSCDFNVIVEPVEKN